MLDKAHKRDALIMDPTLGHMHNAMEPFVQEMSTAARDQSLTLLCR